EPPEEVKNYYKLIDEFTVTRPGSEEYLKLGKKLLTIQVENLWAIGDLRNSLIRLW
ncbi:unnamed protein product, partial [marine sediment metagenome]